MTPRARRLLMAAALLVLLLFAGRWAVVYLADRWWAAALSPEALDAVTRWHLLGLALDAGAVLAASTWFAAQALLVARAIGSVQIERRIGELRVREAIPVRLLLLGAIGTGILLGILTGVGAGAWRAPVALAWQDLRYGVTDPLLGVDLGVLLGEYPVWRLAHQFAALLAVLGIAFAAVLYLGIGAIRRVDGRVEWHPDARRHLGGLLAVLAGVIAIGYLLAPYRLATSPDVPLGPAAAATRVLAANAAAGAAIAVAIISIGWALRSRHSLLTAGWAMLALAALTERLVIPAFVAQGIATADRSEAARGFDAILYGLHPEPDSTVRDSLPAVTTVWDVDALAAWSAGRGGVFLGASQALANRSAAWLVATEFPGDPTTLEVAAVIAGALTPAGAPFLLADDSSHHPLVRDPRIMPGASGWRLARGSGTVPAGGALRRAALAWALQAPGVLAVPGNASLDWALDPQERTRRLVPALTWRTIGMAEHQGRLAWLVSGLATVSRAPLSTRTGLEGRQVAGVVPAMIAAVHADDGSVQLYLDPAADSLGHAWARAAGGLVLPADRIPVWLRRAMPYPIAWFEAQVAVLQQPHWALGRAASEPGDTSMATPVPTWRDGGPSLQFLLEDPARQAPVTLLDASRRAGEAHITVTPLAQLDVPGEAERERAWRRVAGFAQLRDSVRAAGDTLLAGPLRHHRGATGVVSWQPFRSAGRRGNPAVVWLAVARGPAVGGGRDPAAAWASLSLGSDPRDEALPLDAARRFEALRGWVARADSALARGDLTAFARAWEAVCGLMWASPPE